MRRRLSIRSSLISNTGVLVHIVETRSRRQRERERDSLTRTTHPSGYISSRGSRGGRIKKKKKKKKGASNTRSLSRGNRSRNTPVAKPGTIIWFRPWRTTKQRQQQRPNRSARDQMRSSPRFLPPPPPLSLSLSLSLLVGSKERGGRKGEEETLSLFRSVNANERYIWKAGKTCQRAVFIRWNASSPPKTVYTLMHLHPVARLNSF